MNRPAMGCIGVHLGIIDQSFFDESLAHSGNCRFRCHPSCEPGAVFGNCRFQSQGQNFL